MARANCGCEVEVYVSTWVDGDNYADYEIDEVDITVTCPEHTKDK